ncbi:MAG: YifB family Mg chelatase-like AAA ATPase [Halioglobus sp.]
MDIAILHSRAQCGIDAPLVRVEAHLANGLPAFNIVGLPETAVRESKDRVRSALINSYFEFPDRRITINLAPADLPKFGGRFDLPIALGILAASGQLPVQLLHEHEFVGELALDGSLQPIKGTVPVSIACTRDKRTLVVPEASAAQAAAVPGSSVVAAPNLLTLCAHLNGNAPLPKVLPANASAESAYPDLEGVVGQDFARRALEITAAGGHNLLLSGPPGTGKTLLASRLPGILPPLEPEEAVTVLALRSLLDSASTETNSKRPFRAPHHSASTAALIGGGRIPQPGEISLAHCGVLFLDELPEFPRHTLDALRQPLEEGSVSVSRALMRARYPARFQLVAAMNPCPCGFNGDPQRHCRCTPAVVQRYTQRLSGPLLDRFDLHVVVPRIPADQLLAGGSGGECSAAIRERVIACRDIQQSRQGVANGALEREQALEHAGLTSQNQAHLAAAAERFVLSGRGAYRVLKTALTIADLASAQRVERCHIDEALAFRLPGWSC